MGKKDVKLSSLMDDVILYVENPKESTRRWNLINGFSKVADIKINPQKSVVFPYIYNEPPKTCIKNQLHLQ